MRALLLLLLSSLAWGQPSDDVIALSDLVDCTDGATTRSWYPSCPTGWTEVGETTTLAYLAFSDLDDGPDTGIGDGNGSGAIVTVWGRFDCTGIDVRFKDVDTDEYSSLASQLHVYYCQNADGTLPGGPANLYASHKYQELAFSIPDSAPGAGEITVVSGGETSNALPFLVRTGNIYHVRNGGSNANPGTYSAPWATVTGALTNLQGLAQTSTLLYIHDDIVTGCYTCGSGIVWKGQAIGGTIDAQAGVLAYPNSQPEFRGVVGFMPSKASGNDAAGIVLSKTKAFSSNYPSVDANGQHGGTVLNSDVGNETRMFGLSRQGRLVGNYGSDIPGGCASGTNGGVQGNSRYQDTIGNAKMYGNEIADYGCNSSHKLHHTTYFSIRSAAANEQLEAPEVAWNYLHGNDAKGGIHFFDQGTQGQDLCGNWTTKIEIHDNVVVDQRGPGITYTANSCDSWNADVDIYNNTLLNTGGLTTWDGVNESSGHDDGPALAGINLGTNNGINKKIRVFNNILYGWDLDDQTSGGSPVPGGIAYTGSGVSNANLNNEIYDNIFITDTDARFFGYNAAEGGNTTPTVCDNNIFFYNGGGSPTYATQPTGNCTNNINQNPSITRTGDQLAVSSDSPAVGESTTTLTRDIYGIPRALDVVGSVEAE